MAHATGRSDGSLTMDAADLEFCLYEWLDAEALTALPRYNQHDRDTFDGVLELSREVAEELFLPHSRTSDLNEPHIADDRVVVIDEVQRALAAFAEAGLLEAAFDTADGQRLPHLVYRAAMLWFQAANISTTAYASLTSGAAHLIEAHATPELVARYLPPMLDGRWFGTMNLSEPEVGSALGDLTTAAVVQDDGTYRLRGDKMWISGGDHELAENIVHLVLARTGGPGVRGLSLFIVPKWLGELGALTERNDIVLAGLNHKMGYRGTTNAHLAYGSGEFRPGGQPGAVGYLIGEEGKGLTYMFMMMNAARLGVGAGAAAMATAGTLHARRYARERVQGREVTAKEAADPVPIIRHPDVRRMLLSAKAYSEGSVALVLYATRLLDEAEGEPDAAARASALGLLDVLTPIAKSWPSQWGVVANDLAIQVFGGSGYTRDFPVEQLYRDNRLNPIHEGTHGIQAIDLLGRKVLQQDGEPFTRLIERMLATSDRALGLVPELADAVRRRAERLAHVTREVWASRDPAQALGNASNYLEAAGDIVVAWLLLDQRVALAERTDDFAVQKDLTVRFFITHLLPRVDAQLDLVASGDRLLVDLDDSAI